MQKTLSKKISYQRLFLAPLFLSLSLGACGMKVDIGAGDKTHQQKSKTDHAVALRLNLANSLPAGADRITVRLSPSTCEDSVVLGAPLPAERVDAEAVTKDVHDQGAPETKKIPIGNVPLPPIAHVPLPPQGGPCLFEQFFYLFDASNPLLSIESLPAGFYMIFIEVSNKSGQVLKSGQGSVQIVPGKIAQAQVILSSITQSASSGGLDIQVIDVAPAFEAQAK